MAKELPQGYRLGEFSIERLLSRNGLQAHYAARHDSSGRTCRLTVFNVDPDGEPWQRFRSDLGQLQALGHPIIAENLGTGSTPEGQAWAAWAQPAGEELATRLRRGGALTLREALSMARQVAAALHAGHRIDVLHRAVTPENIYFVRPAEGSPADYEQTLLYGFGVARLLEGALDGVALVGQTEYMAPEQFTGLSFDIGPATDQYALALIVYQVLSASQPFHADSAAAALLKVVRSSPEHLRALRPDLPSHVDAAVTRGLAKDRLGRYPDLVAFIGALVADEKMAPGVLMLTDPWIGGSASTDAALSRAAAAGSATPSLGAIAQGMGDGGAGVPEVVEDQATTPNTMEHVMRLALPPERSSPVVPIPPREPSEPIELEPLEPTPPPTTASAAGTKSGRNPASAGAGPGSGKIRGNNLPSRSGETKVPEGESAGQTDAVDTVIVRNIYPSGRKPTVDPTSPEAKSPSVPAAVLPQPVAVPPPAGLAAMLPASLAPHAPRIENVLYLVVGLFLGFLMHTLLK